MQITQDKNALRKSLIKRRREYAEQKKAENSQAAAERLCATREYIDCRAVLAFISTPIEVRTDYILKRAFADGKTVAAPRCAESGNAMDFFVIGGTDDLERGKYGISEPKAECALFDDFSGALCIVPGLAFDSEGMRIGFGRGYYDRFLSRFTGISCGICWDDFIIRKIPSESTDIAVDMLVTESKVYRKNSRNNT